MADYVFPSYIEDDLNTLYLFVYENTSDAEVSGASSKKDFQDTGKKSSVGSVALQLPADISESLTYKWEQEEGTNIADEVLGKGAEYMSGIANKFGKNIGTSLKANTVRDPKWQQLFSGQDPRSFSFSWNLVPESQEDARTLISLLKSLKSWASPDEGVTFYGEPYTWKVSFSNNVLQDAIRFEDCVCEGIEINYTGQGYADFYYDGNPRQVQLTMAFKERAQKYKKDWL